MRNAPRHAGFTLIELLVVLALLGLVAATLLPALAKSRPNTQALQCLNNNRQLCVAWRMYAEDNHDRLVYSSDDGTGSSNPLNQYAWTRIHLDFNPANRGNWDDDYDIIRGPLWRYTGKNPSIYKCPSDHSFVIVNGTALPRVRTMSMNFFLGGFAGSDGGFPGAGGYSLYTNLVQIGGGLPTPGPSKLWVFLDQREDQINWGNFITDMTGYNPHNPAAYQFQDWPGLYHHLAAGFSFADGHGEMHRWRDPRTTPPPFMTVPFNLSPSPNNADIAWLQDHSTRPR